MEPSSPIATVSARLGRRGEARRALPSFCLALSLAGLLAGCASRPAPKVLGYLEAGDGPAGLALSPDGALLAVACAESSEAWVFSLEKEGYPHRRLVTGAQPRALAFNDEGTELLVTESGADSLVRIGLKDGRPLRRGRTGPQPRDFRLTQDGSRILVACAGAPALTILRTRDLGREKDLPLGGAAVGLAGLPDPGPSAGSGQAHAYACTRATDTFSAIKLVDLSVDATMKVGDGPSAAVLSPDGQFAYVACQGPVDASPSSGGGGGAASGSVAVVRLKDWIEVDRITAGAGAQAIAISKTGEHLFVACARSGRLDVLSAAKQERVATLSLKDEPSAILLSKSGKRAYVALSGGNTVAVVDVEAFP